MPPQTPRSFKRSGLILLLAMSLAGMAKAQTVSYMYAAGVNFYEVRTYKWVTIEGAEAADPSIDKSIREAVEFQLTNKGLMKSADHAQVLIAYQVSVRREKEIAMYSVGGFAWGYGPGWLRDESYGFRYGYDFTGAPSFSTATDATIPVGNLVLDMYDASFQDLIWRAEVSNALSFVGEPDKRWQHLTKAVATLFGPYPPKPRK